MTKIKDSDIQHLGTLARIGIDPDLAKELSVQLLDILEYVSKLKAVDTDGVKVTSQVTGLVDVWREDEVSASGISHKELLANAPATQDGYIKVRKVM